MLKHSFKIEISETKMEAFLTINVKEGEESKDNKKMPDVEKTLSYLQRYGIKYGINRVAIERMIKKGMIGETVLVAKGLPSISGSDGSVEYFFSTDSGQTKESSNKIHLRKSKLKGRYVEQGEVLARALSPTNGTQGMTVTGEPIKAGVTGSNIYIIAGRNTQFNDEQEHELRATKSGLVTLQGSTVHVDSTYFLKTNVSPSTGDIDFPGDVIILRDVKSGATVQAGGKLEVNGNVEDATLIADGDIKIKGDYTGSGQGKVIAGENIYLRSIENQTAQAEGSIFVNKLCKNANLTAGESLILDYCEGGVIGSNLCAQWSIVLDIVGDKNRTPTAITLMESGDYNKNIEQLEISIDNLREELKDIKFEIETMQKHKNTDFGREMKIPDRMKVARQKRVDRNSEIARLSEELKLLKYNQEKLGQHGSVWIKTKAFPGVKIVIGNTEYNIEDTRGETKFRRIGNEIHSVSPC